MKTFTAKQFSRTPGKIFDAARDDGKCLITHGHNNEFTLSYNINSEEYLKVKSVLDEHFSGLIKDGMSKWFQPKEKGPEGPDSEQ